MLLSLGDPTRLMIGVICCGAFLASAFASPGLGGLFGGGLALLMAAVAVNDWRELRIPNALTLLALLLGVIDIGFEYGREAPFVLAEAAMRAGCVAAAFLAFRIAYRRLRRREGMGLGDVKLAGVAGVWLSWSSLPIVVELAAGAALLAYSAHQAIEKRPISADARIAFGAFLGPAIWICWLLEALGYLG